MSDVDYWGWVEPEPEEPSDLYANHQRNPLPNTAFPIHIERMNTVSGSKATELTIPFDTTAGANWYDGKTGTWAGWDLLKRKILGFTSASEFFSVDLPDPDDDSTWVINTPAMIGVGPPTGVGIATRPRFAPGDIFYYVGQDSLDANQKKLYIHSALTYAHILTLDWSSFVGVLDGDVNSAFFSPGGRYVAVQLTQTVAGNTYVFLRVYERATGTLVHSIAGTPDLYGWSQDDEYFWYRSGAVTLLETSGWTTVGTSSLSPHPHVMGPVINGDAKWVGGESNFGLNTAKGVVYNFDFTVYDSSFASGSFDHAGVATEGNTDFLPTGDWIIVDCDNINSASEHRYRVSDTVEFTSANTRFAVRTRAFY